MYKAAGAIGFVAAIGFESRKFIVIPGQASIRKEHAVASVIRDRYGRGIASGGLRSELHAFRARGILPGRLCVGPGARELPRQQPVRAQGGRNHAERDTSSGSRVAGRARRPEPGRRRWVHRWRRGQPVGATVCTDITSGDNHSPGVPQGYAAGVGYDAVSGWVTPLGTPIAQLLSQPRGKRSP